MKQYESVALAEEIANTRIVNTIKITSSAEAERNQIPHIINDGITFLLTGIISLLLYFIICLFLAYGRNFN